MIITGISKDKSHLNKLTFDNGGIFFLDRSICVDYSLKIGDKLSDEELKRIYNASQYQRAKSRAMWYLGRRDYSEKELYQKLISAGFEKEVSAKVMARLVELGLVDDRRFAERYAQRCIESNVSQRELISKLWCKGISKELAQEVIEELVIDEEVQLNSLIRGKYAYKLTQPKGTQRVFAALVRKGYSYSQVKKAMSEYLNDNEFCED